jgi:four helix bundle protein
MHQFRKLLVYQKAVSLTTALRKVTRSFPKEELFGLTSQLMRAGYSIALNIAEGAGRRTVKDFSRYLDTAIASAYECLACFDIALSNEFIDAESYDRLNRAVEEIIAMLVGLQKSLVRKPTAPTKPSDD